MMEDIRGFIAKLFEKQAYKFAPNVSKDQLARRC
jgi:hypothetical protein